METVGRVEFIAGLDGRSAVRESKNVGDQIGKEGEKAGAGFGDRFDRELTPRMRLAADRARQVMSSGLQLDGSVLDKTRADIDRFAAGTTASLRTASRDNREALNDMFDVDWSGEFRKMSKDTRDALNDMIPDSFKSRVNDSRNSLQNMWKSIDEGVPGIRKLNFEWSDLSHNTKQWTLIISAVLAGMQSLSVLSSAAGAGLLGIGGALSAAVIGAGGAAAVFAVLAKNVRDLPPELQGAAVQFKEFGRELVNTRDIIASSAIQQMPNTFAKLRSTVQSLNPAFSVLGTSVGKVFDNLADGLAAGTPGFTELNRLVLNAAGDFPALANATGTWATALARGVNEANPLVDQLIGYVGELGNRFDEFTQSDAFGQWIAQSMTTFTAFGELLDATGRALNDLVTPESVARTQEFLDNLTEFMPNLSLLLSTLGELDVFGLAAQALNEFGDALSPLAGPMQDLAGVVNDVAGILISELAVALKAVATVAAPVVQALADVVGAIPPGVLAAIATGVIGVAVAFNTLRGVQGLAGAANAALIASGSFGTLTGVTGRMETASGKLASSLGKFAGSAGLFGAAAVGAVVLVQAGEEVYRSLNKLDDKSREAVASNLGLKDSFEELGVAANIMAQGSIAPIQDWDSALTALGENDFALGLGENFVRGADEGRKLKNVLEELDGPLALLAQQSVPDAAAKFNAWATEVGATDAQVLNMINRMPEFKAQLEAAALTTTGLATDTDLVSLALTGSTTAMKTNGDQVRTLDGQGTVLIGTVERMAEITRQYTDRNLAARDSSRQFEQATDDLADSIKENGNTLDRTTEQGRNNERAVDDLAAATIRYSDDTLKNTGSQEKANAVIADGRQRLLEQLEAFGITGQEAENYADDLGLIVPTVSTQINTPGLSSAWDNARAYEGQIRRIPSSWSTTVTTYYRQVGDAFPKTAKGGTFSGAQTRIIGEAGPEAVVPLNRPLNQVDPSVRGLSAIAQGLAPAPMASGGVVGGGRTVIFEAGSIVVEAAEDPRQTAYDVLEVVSEKISS